MGRKPCCEKIGLKKGPWTADEDKKLRDFIHTNGTQYCCWRAVPKLAGLLRCGKSCRLRWANYLRPDLKSDRLSEEEEKTVIDLHSKFGNRWSKIASKLRGRTDNYIKNYWHNHLKKKLTQMGIDPVTHKPLFPDAPELDPRSNKSKKKGRKNGEMRDDHDIANNNLAIDSGFSTDEIPVVQPHEILIPLTNDCSSSSSIPTPSASSTSTSPSNINLLVQKISNYQRKAYTGNMGYSCEDDFNDWEWLLNDFDINEINHEILLQNSW